MLKGSLDGFPLPDLFRLLSRSKKTGRLDVKRRAGRGQVYFRDGEIYFALTSLSKVPLGQKLIASGVVTEGQLMQALDRNAETGERVGDILVSTEVITTEQLETAVRSQFEDAIFDLLKWEVGDFSWEPGVSIAVEVALGLSVEELLMEASRRLDELEVIQRKIPSAGAVMRMVAKPPEGAANISITSDEWRILTLVDGVRTIGEIARLVGVEELTAMKVLHALVAAGLIEVGSHAGTARPPAVPPPSETLAQAPRPTPPALSGPGPAPQRTAPHTEPAAGAPPLQPAAARPGASPIEGAPPEGAPHEPSPTEGMSSEPEVVSAEKAAPSALPSEPVEAYPGARRAVANLHEPSPDLSPAPQADPIVSYSETYFPGSDEAEAFGGLVPDPALEEYFNAAASVEQLGPGETAEAQAPDAGHYWLGSTSAATRERWFADPEGLNDSGSDGDANEESGASDSLLDSLLYDPPERDATLSEDAVFDPLLFDYSPAPAIGLTPPVVGRPQPSDNGHSERPEPEAGAPVVEPEAAAPEPETEPETELRDGRVRVEDDEQVTGPLVNRLIDGLKNL